MEYNRLNIDDGFLGYQFYNFSDDENRWNKVKIKSVGTEDFDIENIDENSEEYKNLWTISKSEFLNINNSKRFNCENDIKKRAYPLCNDKFCPAKEGDDLCEECGAGFGNNSWHP